MDAKWEYVVVSFGKARFSDVSEGKESGLSKTIIYSEAGLQLGQEALVLQSQMDTLGKFGWELVAAIGTIGGDQQMLFKRLFDPNRSAREAKMIQEEAKALAEKRKAMTSQSEVSLIDLDKIDQDKEDAEVQKGFQEKYSGYGTKAASAKTCTLKGVTVVYENMRLGDTSSRSLKISIVIDGTSALLSDGNKYRRSEAKKLLSAIKYDMSSAAGLKEFGTDTTINLAMTITVNGKEIPVAWDYVWGNSFK